MSRIEFSVWPWRLLALAAPVMAGVSAALAFQDNNRDTFRAQLVFFSVLGAGKSVMLSMAVGRLARLPFAVPLGATVGVVACLASSEFVIRFFVLACMAILLILQVFEKAMLAVTEGISCFGSISFVAFIVVAPIWAAMLVGYIPNETIAFPIASFGVAATLPANFGRGEIVLPMLEGAQAASLGFIGAAVPFLFFHYPGMNFQQIVVVQTIAAALENYYFMRRQFQAIARDVPVPPRSPNVGGWPLDEQRQPAENRADSAALMTDDGQPEGQVK